jgi:hypothetical protein
MAKYLISAVDEDGNILLESEEVQMVYLLEIMPAWVMEIGKVRDRAVVHHLIITKVGE